ncbi:unnamed protein product [Cuscuta europaea]|uniref:Uncharacterized protein n=1 Tax=Cuscuta europaea TaxID=41803 RepID=A0A9P0YIC3_CUSEU|nr:unnamed protein product [Cuscuta europaea]
MGEESEYRCFIGNLAWTISDRALKDEFKRFGTVVEAKVVVNKMDGRSKGFGFVAFDEKKAMEEAIEKMNGIDLDGRAITVDRAQPQGRGGYDNDRPRDRDRGSRDYGGDRGSGGGDCFKCGKPGHFARECPSGGGGGRGGRYGGRDDRYSGGSSGRSSGSHGPDRNGDRYGGGRSRDGGGDRYSRDRSGPYDRRSGGSRAD